MAVDSNGKQGNAGNEMHTKKKKQSDALKKCSEPDSFPVD